MILSRYFKWLLLIVILVNLWAYTTKYSHPDFIDKEIKEETNPGVDLPILTRIEAKIAVFSTDAFLPKKDNSIIKFPYRFDNPHQEMWLSVKMKPQTLPVIILVDHPVFKNIKFNKITNEFFTLYQENSKYKSVDEFLDDPPISEIILADPSIIYDLKLVSGYNVYPLSDWEENMEFKYFITSYHEPEDFGNYLWFESKVDLTNALITPCASQMDCENQISWKLDIPDASSNNALHLGTVHLDQRQW